MTVTSFVDGLRLRSRPLAISLYAVLAVALFGYAAAMRFTLPQQPFIDGDFWGYLHPVVSKLNGGVFQHTYGRDFLYPGFLYLLLKTFQDFRAISVAQHFFGLGTGVLMVLAFRELGRLLCPAARGVYEFVLALLGLGVALAFLLAPSTVYFEQCIRTEGIFPFFAVLSILLNLIFVRLRWREPRPKTAAWLGAASFLVAILLYKLKPAFGFGVVVAGLPLAVSFVTRGMNWWLKVVPLGGMAVFVVVALLLPERRLRADDQMAPLILPDLLYTIHADMIHDQMRDDLAGTAPLPFDRPVLEQLYQRLEEAIPLSRGPGCHIYPSLGFDPDYILFVNKVFETTRHPIKVWHLRPSIGYTYYFRVATHHPLRMLAKIATQMECFYHFQPRPQFRFTGQFTRFHAGEYARPLAKLYAGNLDISNSAALHEVLDRFAPTIPYVAESRKLMATTQEIPLNTFAASLQAWLAALYLPGLLAVLATCGWTLLTSRGRSRWLVASLAVLLIYGYNFGNNLTVAIIHSLDVGRYVENQSAYTYLASLVGWVFVGGVLRSVVAGAVGKVEVTRFVPPGEAAFPSLLPRLVRSGKAPSLSIVLVNSGSARDGAPVQANCREIFPDARLLMLDDSPGKANGVLPGDVFTRLADLLDAADTDLILVVDSSQAHAPNAWHGLLQSYAELPTDLVIGARSWEQTPEPSAKPKNPWDVERVISWLFGWKPASPLSAAHLLSRRFYESLPTDLRTEFLPLELGLHALGEGYSLREASAAVPQETTTIVHPSEEGRRANWPKLCLALARGFEWKPLKVSCIPAVGFVLLGAMLGYTPLHHLSDRNHQIRHAVQATLAGGLFVASLLSLQAGIILQWKVRQDRKARHLRLRRFHPRG